MARSKKAQAAIDSALSIPSPSDQVGLGVDLVEIDRMRTILKRTPAFKDRLFSTEEIAYCEAHADPAASFAARFAAKEAAVKALGSGFSQGIGYRDIEVIRASTGKPSLVFRGKAEALAQERGVVETALSLSHTAHDAIACVIAITAGSVAAMERRIDPAAELAKQFKEAKALLDDLERCPSAPKERNEGERLVEEGK